jgi:hypothetical protein
VRALDQERCRAISEQEWDALSALLADDLPHAHMTGVTQDKPTYLAHVQQNPAEPAARSPRSPVPERAVPTGAGRGEAGPVITRRSAVFSRSVVLT